MQLTSKQIELMCVITKGNGPNEPPDLDEIVERVRYETTKQSLQFSVRALMARGLIIRRGVEKRRCRQRQVIEATPLGFAVMGVVNATGVAPYISSEEDDALYAALES